MAARRKRREELRLRRERKPDRDIAEMDLRGSSTEETVGSLFDTGPRNSNIF